MNIDMSKRMARQCGAEAVANNLPSWTKDDREDIAYYCDGVEEWSEIPEDDQFILLKAYREGERAEKDHKDSV